jgi:hypothetical protein
MIETQFFEQRILREIGDLSDLVMGGREFGELGETGKRGKFLDLVMG